MPRVKIGPAPPDRKTLDVEIAHLRDLDAAALRVRWQNVFKRQPPHLPRHILFRMLAYRLQANHLGEQNTIPAQIVATEPAIEKLGEPDDIAITGANDVKVVPVKTIQASSATESSTRSDDKLTRDDRLDQGTMAPQIVTTEPTIKKLSGATPEVDGITMTAPDNAQDAPVGAIQTRDETRTVESSSRHDDKPKLDVPIEQTAMSAQTMAPGPAIQTIDQPVGATIPAPGSVEGLPVQGDLPQQQTPSVGVLSATLDDPIE